MKNFCLWALSLTLLHGQTAKSDPAGVLAGYAIARFVGSGSDSIRAMASDPAGNLYIAGTTSSPDLPMKNALQPEIGEATVMRSTDGGRSWQRLANVPADTIEITPHTGDPRILFCSSRNGIHRSSDSGLTWRQVHSWNPIAVGLSDTANIALDPANPSLAYAYLQTSEERLVFASTDGGEHWLERATLPYASSLSSGDRQLWVDPSGSGIVVVRMALSMDRGFSWKILSLPGNEDADFTTPDPQHAGWIYAANSSSFYLSKDWGETWTKKAVPESERVYYLIVDPELPNTLYSSTGSRLFVSRDGAATWQLAAAPEPGSFGYGQLALTRGQCAGDAFLSVLGGTIVSSPEFGSTWRPTPVRSVRKMGTGPGCAAYLLRSWTSDAFIAKLSPRGELLWSTFLGGSDRETAISLVISPRGDVYVAGTTTSLDFPVTVARRGVPGRQNAFLARLDQEGRLIYATVVGGEKAETVMDLAVSAEGDAYVTGTTESESFPTTPGTYLARRTPWHSGFAVRLGPDGRLIFGTYLRYELSEYLYKPRGSWEEELIVPITPLAVAVEADGSALIGGNVDQLSRLSPDGSTVTAVAQLPGQVHLISTDSQGDVYVAGQVTRWPLISRSCYYGVVRRVAMDMPAGDTYVARFQSGSLKEIYSTRLGGSCRTQPVAMRVGASGELTLGLWAFGTLPLRNPMLASPFGRAAVAGLSPDGAELLFSTYVATNVSWEGRFVDENPGARAIALGTGDSLYAGITGERYQAPSHAAVLELPVSSRTVSVHSISQTLSGARDRFRPGALVTISGSGLSSTFVDLGLNYPDPLPLSLGGVQVLFDGVPAEMFQVAPDQVICVAPEALLDRQWVEVQVISGSQKSQPFIAWPHLYATELLTRAFPSAPPAGADGEIYNADGTPNGPDHPAAPGSTITLFATGLTGPGPVGLLWAPKRWVPTTVQGLNASAPVRVSAMAEAMPGFIRVLYAIRFRVPDALGPGVEYLPPAGVVTRVVIGLDNEVGVSVK